MSSISAMSKKKAKPPSWSAMGSGISGNVTAIYALNESNVYVGGSFTSVGGNTSIKYIAKWNGNNWTALGGGMSNEVAAIYAVDANNVYVGGNFDTATNIIEGVAVNVTVNKIAKWDGANWTALGAGVNANVTAIYAVDANNVYVGGGTFFNTATNIIEGVAVNVTVNCIAKWDGANWSKMGGGVNGAVNAIYAVDTNNIYVGGNFSTASNVTGGGGATVNVTVNKIAKWDGSNWTALGGGVSSIVYAIHGYANNIYVGGNFNTAYNVTGGTTVNVTVNKIAKWDVTNWSALGNGVSDIVQEVYAVNENNIYAGGNFDTAYNVTGGTTVNVTVKRIAKWDGNNWTAMGTGMNSPSSVLAIYVYANNVYAGGSFTTAGGVTVNRIAVWK